MHSDFEYRKKCRDYERQWRDFCVDANLEDAWLEKLNSLDHFELSGICEGHKRRKGSGEHCPYINIRVKRHNKSRLNDGDITAFLPLLKELFREEFSSNDNKAVLHINFLCPNNSFSEGIYDLAVSLRPPNLKPFDDDQVRKSWFENAIIKLVIFDQKWGERLEHFLKPCGYNEFLG